MKMMKKQIYGHLRRARLRENNLIPCTKTLILSTSQTSRIWLPKNGFARRPKAKNSKHMWSLTKTQAETFHNTSRLCSESSPTMIRTPQIDSNASRISRASMKREGGLDWVTHLI